MKKKKLKKVKPRNPIERGLICGPHGAVRRQKVHTSKKTYSRKNKSSNNS